MFCKNCGAVITGKYCSCCGSRVRSAGQDFFLAVRKRKREFVNTRYHKANDLATMRTAAFCWDTIENQTIEPLRSRILACDSIIGSEDLLDTTEEKADRLYMQVCESIRYCS